MEGARETGAAEISGESAFQLYDTFGFPIDLTREILAQDGLAVDEEGFRQAMEAQEQARKSRTAHGYLDSSLEAYKELAGAVTTEFVGYECFEADSKIMGIIVDGHSVDSAREGEEVALVLDRTPFYAESGGQIGDQGIIQTETGVVRVNDVRRPVEGLVSHFGVVESGYIAAASAAKAVISAQQRQETARHHTATHLLHRALKDILGEHVNQAGSYVGPQRLRFDFTHFQALTVEELKQIEAEVNRQILRNSPVVPSITDLESAKEQGAVALFGEKYGDQVRMVQVGDYSLELCGGTHVQATGEIGTFKIISEGSVAAGVRRIEAVVGMEALAHIRAQEQVLEELQTKLQSKVEQLPEQVERLIEANRALEKELAELKRQHLLGSLDDLLARAEQVGNAFLLVAEVEADNPEELRELGDRIRDRLDPVAILWVPRAAVRCFS